MKFHLNPIIGISEDDYVNCLQTTDGRMTAHRKSPSGLWTVELKTPY